MNISPPIAYIVFNRPAHTRRSFATLRAQQPEKLFIIADGPRSGHPTDADRCREVREIVADIDWPCTVLRNYAELNLGIKQRISSGLDWVFHEVEQAVILEDDCVPHPDFFRFCGELLARYAADIRVWTITGDNFQDGRVRGAASYYFSKYSHCWGWATWRRAWRHYQGDLPFFREWQQSEGWRQLHPDPVEQSYWLQILTAAARGEIDSWAYPWTACVWFNKGLTVTPNVNLVRNIGCGPEGTHMVAEEDRDGLQVYPLGRINHPSRVNQDRKADRYVFDHHFSGMALRQQQRSGRLYWRAMMLLVTIGKELVRKLTRTGGSS